ncbi:MAG: filamentous hemagglutinin N-terminal domain-containing protein, partial [Gammaproteobacteria bacterium]|nr:filamentous hemagglutinin N-terminal domain-containing protein [Gammaproteobacteria bacterium]
MQKKYLPCIVLYIASSASAEVVLDGTLGTAGSLTGPGFMIQAEMGKQKENNLFHSFSRFNLNQGESAVFSGPETIQNIISRVTGKEVSHIDGRLSSDIAGADMYFLNLAGIIFGPHAQLDVAGSFYASTADYLRLGENGRFDAAQPELSRLSMAPPGAFGFLSDMPAEIIKEAHGSLAVPAGKTLGFVGGNISLPDNNTRMDINQAPGLNAADGQIMLVSAASPGEVPLNPEESPTLEKYGAITIKDVPIGVRNSNKSANLDASGADGGKIFIRGGNVFLEGAYVFADTRGTGTGGGGIVLEAGSITAQGGSRITADALWTAAGKSGDIVVKAERLKLSGGSEIAATTRGPGNAGNIHLEITREIELAGLHERGRNKGGIHSDTLVYSGENAGSGGRIFIKTPELRVVENARIDAGTWGFGDAGNIDLDIERLVVSKGGQINVSTGPRYPQGGGKGGTLRIVAGESVQISGMGAYQAALVSNVRSAGKGGNIEISTPLLEIGDNGTIQTATGIEGTGEAGEITLNVDILRVNGSGFISSETQSGEISGLGGNIDIEANKAVLTGAGKEGSAIKASSTGLADAGDINIRAANSLRMRDTAVNADAHGTAGGNIQISSSGYLYLTNSRITTSALDEKGRVGNGGNMRLTPEFIVLDNGGILARAVAGKGGRIDIT